MFAIAALVLTVPQPSHIAAAATPTKGTQKGALVPAATTTKEAKSKEADAIADSINKVADSINEGAVTDGVNTGYTKFSALSANEQDAIAEKVIKKLNICQGGCCYGPGTQFPACMGYNILGNCKTCTGTCPACLGCGGPGCDDPGPPKDCASADPLECPKGCFQCTRPGVQPICLASSQTFHSTSRSAYLQMHLHDR